MLLRAIYEWFMIGSSENIRFFRHFPNLSTTIKCVESRLSCVKSLPRLTARSSLLLLIRRTPGDYKIKTVSLFFFNKKKQTPGIGIYQSQPTEFTVCIFERCAHEHVDDSVWRYSLSSVSNGGGNQEATGSKVQDQSKYSHKTSSCGFYLCAG